MCSGVDCFRVADRLSGAINITIGFDDVISKVYEARSNP